MIGNRDFAVNVWGTRKSSDLQKLDHARQDEHHRHPQRPSSWPLVIMAATSPTASAQPGTDSASGPIFGLAMITVLWAYEGWQFGTYSAGEVIEPQKKLSPALFLMGSLILCRTLSTRCRRSYPLFALGPPRHGHEPTPIRRHIPSRSSWAPGPARSSRSTPFLIPSYFQRRQYSVILTAPRVFSYAMANDKTFFQEARRKVHPRF